MPLSFSRVSAEDQRFLVKGTGQVSVALKKDLKDSHKAVWDAKARGWYLPADTDENVLSAKLNAANSAAEVAVVEVVQEEKKSAPKKVKKSEKKTEAAAPAVEEKKAKKERKQKDPNAPKRNQTAFFLYMNAHRAEYKAAHPEAKLTEVTKGVSADWKTVTAEVKAKYEELSAKDKERYVAAMAAYKSTL